MYARLIAIGLRMSEPEIDTVVKVGLMHDVGKIGVRNDKLNKPGKLTPEELAMFRSHPAKGKRILEPIPFMRDIVPGCYCHHEAWDGSGYPQGLMADNIPLIGRIVAIADAYDAMTSDRAYRKALPHEIACGELERCIGLAVRPRDRPGVPRPDRGVPEARSHRRAASSRASAHAVFAARPATAISSRAIGGGPMNKLARRIARSSRSLGADAGARAPRTVAEPPAPSGAAVRGGARAGALDRWPRRPRQRRRAPPLQPPAHLPRAASRLPRRRSAATAGRARRRRAAAAAPATAAASPARRAALKPAPELDTLEVLPRQVEVRRASSSPRRCSAPSTPSRRPPRRSWRPTTSGSRSRYEEKKTKEHPGLKVKGLWGYDQGIEAVRARRRRQPRRVGHRQRPGLGGRQDDLDRRALGPDGAHAVPPHLHQEERQGLDARPRAARTRRQVGPRPKKSPARSSAGKKRAWRTFALRARGGD